MTATSELFEIVDFLVSKGAVALEVTHNGSVIKCNLERSLARSSELVEGEDALSVQDKRIQDAFAESVYLRAASEDE